MTFLNAETMFLLSLNSESRERVSDLVNEAVQLMSSGLSVKEVEERLESDLKLLESQTPTPRMVRHIVLGAVDNRESGTMAISTQAPAV